RRKVFGPLFYSTLVVALLATAYTEFVTLWPRIEERHRIVSLVSALRGAEPRARESAAAALVQIDDGAGLPSLLEAVRDARAEVRAQACRWLAQAGGDPSAVVPVLVAAAGGRPAAGR